MCFLIIEQTFGYNFPMPTSHRRPLTEADLLKIREQWGDDPRGAYLALGNRSPKEIGEATVRQDDRVARLRSKGNHRP